MKIILENSYEKLSETLAMIMISEMSKPGRVNVDFTDGVSPVGAYELVAKKVQEDPERYHNVHYYSHGESTYPPKSVAGMLKEQIFDPFMVPQENIHLIDVNDIYKQIHDIEAAGGLDLSVLGLGADAHFCVNFPDSTQFDKLIYKYEPKDYDWYEETRKKYGIDAFSGMVTFGFKMVAKTRRVVMIVNGTNKAQAVKDMLTQPISTHYPATILRCLDNFTLILDADAASLLTEEDIANAKL
ncbi:6-phosphogluconolactonase [Culicoidibacter larvae]|uniref:Glucosamine/galactosamine-6-phosphate isomerase domain-containing protein n=1 Tax=Culicoidibacter larvae TaxID=2579976 RepID=A0A5R8Q8L8_9FIRM|nr:6-phosphogluconolactonase [Culicoidibacter larvae]TLG71519.1 hypothetical protein FEZ08_10515 [Culicoidibacter larvae]